MPNRTTLATGNVTSADTLTIELVTPPDAPQVILIRWPGAPSVTDQRRLAEVARAVTTVLAEAIAKGPFSRRVSCRPSAQDHEAPGDSAGGFVFADVRSSLRGDDGVVRAVCLHELDHLLHRDRRPEKFNGRGEALVHQCL